jgi:hypothetical protein
VRRWSGRKRAIGTRRRLRCRQPPNQRRSLDFASDAFSDGRRFRILTIVDNFTREARRSWPMRHCPGFGCGHSLRLRGTPRCNLGLYSGNLTATALSIDGQREGQMPATEASFKKLVDVPVHYDRLPAPFGYGSKGKNLRFECRNKLKNALESCFEELLKFGTATSRHHARPHATLEPLSGRWIEPGRTVAPVSPRLVSERGTDVRRSNACQPRSPRACVSFQIGYRGGCCDVLHDAACASAKRLDHSAGPHDA